MKQVKKYKQTEIGEIPENWELNKLSSLSIEIIDGDRGVNYPKQGELLPEGYCLFLSTKNVPFDKFDFSENLFITKEKDEILRKGKLQRGDVVLTTRGTVGNLALFDKNIPFDNIRINSGMVILRNTGKDFNLEFLYQLLKSTVLKQQYASFSSGSAQPQLPIKDLKSILLIKPPISEQQQIASILSSLDNKIELNRKMNRTLEEIGKALFKRWFVDFEFPDEDGKPYKSSGGKMVELESGEIPQGWKIVALETIFDFLEGPGIRNWQYSEEGTKFINIRLIDNGDINIKSANFINQKDVETKYQHFLLKAGDMVVSTSGTLGKSAIVRKSHLPLLLNTSVIRFRPKDGVSYPFMYLYLQSEYFLSEQIRLSAGSVQANFGPSHLKQMEILIPDKNIFESFNNICTGLYQQIIANMDENELLSTIRDSLLPRLMSGRLRV